MLILRAQRMAIGAVVATIMAVAAPAAGAGESAPDARLPPPPEVSAVPIPPGQIEKAIERIDGIADRYRREKGVPGMAMAIVHDGEVVHAKGYGVRSTLTGSPVDEQTVFQVASLSKPIGSAVVARAVGKGAADWDDKVIDHLPWFKLRDPMSTQNVTIADLYSHRSGLPDHAGDMLEDLGFNRLQILQRLRHVPLNPLRQEYAYTNFGLTTAAVAVARSAGMSWADMSERMIYRPLGMRSTSSRFRDFMRRANRASTHERRNGDWLPVRRRDPDAQAPAGGVSSNVSDLARWMKMYLSRGEVGDRKLIGSQSFAEIRTPHILTSQPNTMQSRSSHYGLGIGIGADMTGRVRFTHSGAFLTGASTIMAMLPSQDLGIIVLTNASPTGVPEATAETFLDLAETGEVERDWLSAYQALIDPMYRNPSRLAGRTRPGEPSAPGKISTYTGTYRNGYYGPARVFLRGRKMIMSLGPEPEQFRLRHWSGNTFFYFPRGENAVGISAVTFSKRAAGGRRAMRVEDLDELGLGLFRPAVRPES